MKKLLMILIVAVFAFTGTVYAEKVVMPNGQEIDLDGLSADEKKNMMHYIIKLSDAQKKAVKTDGVADTLKEVAKNPNALNEWRVMITGTIKDIANDLNVTVNEFVKTPVGLGIAGLIIYKVAGKDLVVTLMDIILIVPFWFVAMGILFILQKRYFGIITVYREVRTEHKDNGKPVVTKYDPERKHRYPWQSDDARVMGAVMIYGCMIIVTVASLIIVF